MSNNNFFHNDTKREITLKGRLCVASENNIFLEVLEHIEGIENRILVNDPMLYDRLLENVPCWVGSNYLYADIVQLKGVLVSQNGEMMITNIVFFQLTRENEVYNLLE